ncbi:hypothetical protein F5Y15DRAFT_255257 [Xylariaceae sp. FL0016]|nr:hypothetical protein F5Y15DRAFT_255257 [Xylariaceae sp. FL0016]
MMSGLPDGWESDYDGKRWFYRYKPTGLTQFNFPRPGDEFPEFFDTGYGPLDLAPEEQLAIDREAKRRSTLENGYAGGNIKMGGSRKRNMGGIEKEGEMSATGYFDPNMYFGPGAYNDVSPVADEEEDGIRASTSNHLSPPITNIQPVSGHRVVTIPNSGLTNSKSAVYVETHELPENTAQVWSPVGCVAELATSDTIKCAEELAPVELDAAAIPVSSIKTEILQDEPAELPTRNSPVEGKFPSQQAHSQQPSADNAHPLMLASFGPLPAKVNSDLVGSTTSTSDTLFLEQKVLVSQSPVVDSKRQSIYSPWTPSQNIKEDARKQDRKSMSLSHISVLQSQENELGALDKRQSLAGPIESLKLDQSIPTVLVPPSGPKPPAQGPAMQSEQHSPIPSALQPAPAPLKTAIPGESGDHDSIDMRPPPILSSAARHESISEPGRVTESSSSPVPGLAHHPSILKPGRLQNVSSSVPQTSSRPSSQFPPQQPPALHQPHVQDGSVAKPHSAASQSDHNVGFIPQNNPPLPSQATGAPGFLLFHEIPPSQGSGYHQSPDQENSNLPSHTNQQFHRVNDTLSGKPATPAHLVMHDTFHAGAPSASSKPNLPDGINEHPHTNNDQHPVPPSSQIAPQLSEQISEVISVVNGSPPPEVVLPSQTPDHGNTQKPTDVDGGGQVSALDVSQASQSSPAILTQISATDYPAPVPVKPSSGHDTSPSKPVVTTSQSFYPTPPPDRIQTPSSQGVFSSFVSPCSTPGLGHRPSLSGSVQGSSGHSQSAFQRPPSGSPQGSKPSSNHGSDTSTVTSGYIMHATVNGPDSQPEPQMLNQSIQSTPHTRPDQTHSPVKPDPSTGSSNQAPSSSAQATLQGPFSDFASPVIFPSKPPSNCPSVLPQATTRPSVQGSGSASNLDQAVAPLHQPVSPPQSQMPSPAQSMASVYRPQSSASTHTQSSTYSFPRPSSISHQGMASVHSQGSKPHSTSAPLPAQPAPFQHGTSQSHPPQYLHKPSIGAATGSHMVPQQSTQSIGPTKPYPMLPGQVTPLPSQVGSSPLPMPAQNHAVSSPQKPNVGLQPGYANQQKPTLPPMPHFQSQAIPGQPVFTQSPPGSGQTPTGPRPPVQHQTQMPARPQVTQLPGQALPQINTTVPQSASLPVGMSAQAQFTGSPAVMSPGQVQPLLHHQALSGPGPHQTAMASPMSPGQLQQQHAQNQGQPSSFPSPLQGKPFNSAQATAALQGAGKGMKKLAKKFWTPAMKQGTAAITGAILAESLGVSAAAGAKLGNHVYNATQNQSKPPAQAGQPPQRPPGPPHAQTAPPQAQGMAQVQFTGQQQPGPRPVGIQTPGRPPVVQMQNPAMAGATMNANVGPQQQGQQLVHAMHRPPPAQVIQRPPVGRPPPPSAPQPGNNGNGQPMFQAQVNMDPNVAASVAVIGAVGAAGRADQPQLQQQQQQQNQQYHQAQPQHQVQPQGQPYSYQNEHSRDENVEQSQSQSQNQNQNQSYEQTNEMNVFIDNSTYVSTTESYFASSPPPPAPPLATMPMTTGYVDSNTTLMMDTVYVDNDNNNNNTTVMADAAYVDTSTTCVDSSMTAGYVDTNATMVADATTYVDTNTSYVDTSTTYVDATYVDTTVVDTTYADTSYTDNTCVDVNVDVSITETVDYSGGEWGDCW